MRQAEVEGVVSTLHHLPQSRHGRPQDIAERQAAIAVICMDFMPVLDRTGTDPALRVPSDLLAEAMPLAQDLGMRLGCHPDAPTFPLPGLRLLHVDRSRLRADHAGGRPLLKWHHALFRFALGAGRE